MNRIISGRYCGPYNTLTGHRAILLNEEHCSLLPGCIQTQVLAQFDNVRLVHPEDKTVYLGYHWHLFPASDFNDFYVSES